MSCCPVVKLAGTLPLVSTRDQIQYNRESLQQVMDMTNAIFNLVEDKPESTRSRWQLRVVFNCLLLALCRAVQCMRLLVMHGRSVMRLAS